MFFFFFPTKNFFGFVVFSNEKLFAFFFSEEKPGKTKATYMSDCGEGSLGCFARQRGMKPLFNRSRQMSKTCKTSSERRNPHQNPTKILPKTLETSQKKTENIKKTPQKNEKNQGGPPFFPAQNKKKTTPHAPELLLDRGLLLNFGPWQNPKSSPPR